MNRAYTESEWISKGYEIKTGQGSTQRNGYGQRLFTEDQVRRKASSIRSGSSNYESPSQSSSYSYDDGGASTALMVASIAASTYDFGCGCSGGCD